MFYFLPEFLLSFHLDRDVFDEGGQHVFGLFFDHFLVVAHHLQQVGLGYLVMGTHAEVHHLRVDPLAGVSQPALKFLAIDLSDGLIDHALYLFLGRDVLDVERQVSGLMS